MKYEIPESDYETMTPGEAGFFAGRQNGKSDSHS